MSDAVNSLVLLTEKTGAVLELLKEVGGPMTAAEVAEALPNLFPGGARSVTAIMTGLGRRALIDKEKIQVEYVKADGTEGVKPATRYWVNDAGKSFEYGIKA